MIAVTGATGHLGNVLVRKLVGMGENVRALVAPFEDTKPLEGLNVEIFKGDVRGIGKPSRGSAKVHERSFTSRLSSRSLEEENSFTM